MFTEPKFATQDHRALRAAMRAPVLAGTLIAGSFFGAAGLWATLVPIASAAMAPAEISPEGHRRTVQHLEGGIVREIKVRDGDRVRRGDVLLVLEDTQALSAYRVQETRLLSLRAMEARLAAEESGAATPDWSTVPRAEGRAEAIADQARVFRSQLENNANAGKILNQRINQLEEEIGGLEGQIVAERAQLGLIDQEIGMLAELIDKGLARKPRLLELQRAQAEIQGRLASNRAAIARARQSIGETRLEILQLETRRRDEAANRLSEARTEIADLAERMIGTRDVLNRTTVFAPVDGTVFDLRIKTTGGVLRAGDPILDLVPDGDELLVDARVSLTDIDVVRVGMEAEVALTALPQRNLPKMKGTVRHVSADRLTDEMTGEPYYLARIAIHPSSLEALEDGMELVPGMPADTMIFTGTRTLVDYLLDPLLQSLDRSFRET